MDIQYDTEQTILRDGAEKFLSGRYDYRTFQKTADSAAGWSQDFWTEIAELGWLGLPFAEDDGGFGAGAVEIAIVMESFGKSLVLEPYVPTVVLGGGIVAKLGAPTQRQEILGPVIEGKSRLAFAVQDQANPTEAKKSANGFTLSGAKKIVLGAPMADTLLVSAKIGNGVGVFVVPAGTRGVTVRGYRSLDGGRIADIELVDVALPASSLLGGNEQAGAAIEETVHRAIAALSSDAVGRDVGTGRADRGIYQDARPIRPAAGQVPGVAASDGRHEGQGGRGPGLMPVRDAQSRWIGRAARTRRRRRQGENRPRVA